MKMAVKLYHYTSEAHLNEILEYGGLRLTPSNLLKPKGLHLDLERGAYVSETDGYRPVVWLTSDNGASTTSLGNHDDPCSGKVAVRITIEKTRDMVPWHRWARDNGISPQWFKSLKSGASGWREFFVCEREIPVDEFKAVRVLGADVPLDELGNKA